MIQLPLKITLCCLLFGATTLFAERNLLSATYSAEIVQNQLQLTQLWVPYPAYANRAAWRALMGENGAQLIKNGEKYLDYKWQISVATDYLAYERTGNRNIMQVPQTANNLALSDLVLAELAEGEGRFIDQIINGVFYQCERTSWVLSAHLPRQSTQRSLPDWREQIIDLGSGEIGAFMAWIHYFFHEEFDKIDASIAARIRYEIDKRILTPFFVNEREWWMAFHLKPDDLVNNWNPWCNFNVLQCFLLIENDTDRLVKGVYRTMQSVDKFINYVKKDGACEEGPAYWGHAAGKMFDYLELLKNATKGSIDLFDNEQIRAMGEYISRSYVANGWVVNFADASAKYGDNNASLIYSYGKALQSDELMQFGAYLASNRAWNITNGTDIYRSLRSISIHEELKQKPARHETPAVTWYPETEFCYMKRNDWFLGVKGGYNAESHNHNDAGTFVLYYKGIPMLIDAGVGTYTKQTFSQERYDIWTMQSQYHNLPTINGYQQKFGRNFKAQLVHYNEKREQIAFDIAGAYPAQAGIKYWKRGYQLQKNGLQITDDAEVENPTTPHILNFMVWGNVDVSKVGKVQLTVQGQTVGLTYNSAEFELQIEEIPQSDTRLSRIWGDVIYRVQLKQRNITQKFKNRITIQ